MADETCTIRTSSGRIYGRFANRHEAWTVIERIRREPHHRDSVHAAQVVPLLDGVSPMPLHPRWLSDVIDEPASLDRSELLGAVDRFVGAHNDARSQRRGYRYVSGYLLTSDPDLQTAVRVLLAPLYRDVEKLSAERDRFRGHSVTLNSVAFAMAEALGDVPPDADQVEGNPLDQVARLVGTLERRTAQRDAARADADAARAEVAELTAKLEYARDRPWHADASGR